MTTLYQQLPLRWKVIFRFLAGLTIPTVAGAAGGFPTEGGALAMVVVAMVAGGAREVVGQVWGGGGGKGE